MKHAVAFFVGPKNGKMIAEVVRLYVFNFFFFSRYLLKLIV